MPCFFRAFTSATRCLWAGPVTRICGWAFKGSCLRFVDGIYKYILSIQNVKNVNRLAYCLQNVKGLCESSFRGYDGSCPYNKAIKVLSVEEERSEVGDLLFEHH